MKVKRIAIYIITNIALFIIACITNHKLKITTGTTIEEEVKHSNEYIRKILKRKIKRDANRC